MLSILINAIVVVAIVFTTAFSLWTFIDTKRKYSMNEFNNSKINRLDEANKRYKEKTRLGK